MTTSFLSWILFFFFFFLGFKLSFIWGKMRAAGGERVPGDSFEKLLKRGRERGGQYVCDFGEARVHAIKRMFFPEDFC